ncbi:MAG: YqgE/AlgH family protein [Rhizobiaceae bacterium]
METLEGQFLIAMPGMGDARFEKTVIYICAHSAEGAMGFVINKTLDAPSIPDFLSQLNIVNGDEIRSIPDNILQAPLYRGGPVEPGRGFVLHSPEYTSDTTLPVSDGVSLTATLEILRAIATGRGPTKMLLALGYSGWAGGQLEEEIASNGWLTVPSQNSILFDCDNATKYAEALKMLGVDPALLSGDIGHA